MINPKQFLRDVIRPVLAAMGMGGPAAEALLLGTAITESNLEWLRQLGGGPALGFYQMAPATHDDIWTHYIGHNVALQMAMERWGRTRTAEEMVWNLAYASAMARLQYRRRPEPLPVADAAMAMAMYWKAHYNTAAGKGDPARTVIHFERAIAVVRMSSYAAPAATEDGS